MDIEKDKPPESLFMEVGYDPDSKADKK